MGTLTLEKRPLDRPRGESRGPGATGFQVAVLAMRKPTASKSSSWSTSGERRPRGLPPSGNPVMVPLCVGRPRDLPRTGSHYLRRIAR